MNKADITVMHINACESYEEACRKIMNPVEGFGYKLTKIEMSFALHYAKAYFGLSNK